MGAGAVLTRERKAGNTTLVALALPAGCASETLPPPATQFIAVMLCDCEPVRVG